MASPTVQPGNHAHLGHTETLEGAVATLEAPATGIDRLTMAIEAIGYSDRALAYARCIGYPRRLRGGHRSGTAQHVFAR